MLRSRAVLKKAWLKIRSNGASPQASRQTRRLVSEFAETEDRGIERIQEKLHSKPYVFGPARGVAIPKPGKPEKRPLVVFDIETRIVQRAILDLVKELPPVKSTLQSGYNFGGVEGNESSVPAAVKEVVKSTEKYGYFIRSDIKKFFDTVGRQAAVSALTRHIHDQDFIALVNAATTVELSNRQALGSDAKYFPSAEFGLAQGSCLSPLLCNLVLDEFDTALNAKGNRCIRFVDDFILFGRDRKKTRAGLAIGISILEKLGLSAYDPQLNASKAEEGETTSEINFLGCQITEQLIKPSLSNRRSLLKKVDVLLAKHQDGVTDILGDVARTVQGWGNTFGFCTDEHAMNDLDIELHKRIQTELYRRLSVSRHLDAVAWLTKIGIQPLALRKRP
jgi:retron-type reverse transcriptase